MVASTKSSSGEAVAGVAITSEAASNRASAPLVITIGTALWARKMATSLATSSAVESNSPAAHTKISGSDDKSMCFLSSVVSQAMDL